MDVSERPPALSWWPHESIRSRQKDLQRHLDQVPGTKGPIHSWADYTRRGEIDTLNHLWVHRERPDTRAAILIAASLFSRLQSSRYGYPRDMWPDRDCVQVLEGWAYDAWPDQGRYHAWHYSCTQVLPEMLHDYGRQLTDMGSLVSYLAQEHAHVLHKYCPVVIEFSPEPDPHVALELAMEREVEKQHRAAWEQQHAETMASRQAKRQQRQQDHPRASEWRALTSEALVRLVWSKSTVELAKEFGVSDVAIAKRCRKAGIAKPPRGFWAKVEAGKIPHPNGTPIIAPEKRKGQSS